MLRNNNTFYITMTFGRKQNALRTACRNVFLFFIINLATLSHMLSATHHHLGSDSCHLLRTDLATLSHLNDVWINLSGFLLRYAFYASRCRPIKLGSSHSMRMIQTLNSVNVLIGAMVNLYVCSVLVIGFVK